MKVIITAGGTGGHIYPALAVLNKIKEDKNNEVLYIGTKDRMEHDLIPSLGIPYKSLEVYGLTKNIVKNARNIKCLNKAVTECKKIIKEFKPDIVIGFGGYVTCPVLIAAKKLGVKTAIHEQNYLPGKVNRFLGNKCDEVFISFKENEQYFKKTKVFYTGNPCAEHAINIEPATKEELGLSKNKKLILIVMGSLGSGVVNEKMKDFLTEFKSNDKEIVFITGRAFYESFKDLKVPDSVKIIAYYDELPKLMKISDLIIARAGASTISEILALDLPSILIPSPYVANNHQYYNALDLQNKKQGLMLQQKDLTKETLAEMINKVLDDKDYYSDMKNRLSLLPKLNGSTLIYEEIKKLIK